MIHARTHPGLDVDGCYACRLASVQITPSARGSAIAQRTNATEAQWNIDMPAYKRLRDDGVQPRKVDGAARVEATASTLNEVEGHPPDIVPLSVSA